MLFSLLYMVLRVIFGLAASGEERDREVEILVLRHEVKVSLAGVTRRATFTSTSTGSSMS